MGIAMPGVRSSNPSLPAVTGAFEPSLARPRYRDWGSTDTRSDSERVAQWSRRAVNLLLALVAVIVTLPVMLLVALLVRLTSRGPVFYTQVRIGLDRREPVLGSQNHRRGRDLGGQPFTIYKFRTMRPAPPNASQVWAQKNDPRITSVGRILRKFRLDELPQLFNVLKGEMNVVGPRPEQPDIVKRLRTSIRHYAERQLVLPGITGLAQVTMGYDSSVADVRRKVALDLEYLRRRSPLEDLRIMARTTLVMLGAHGT
jgi:lipopolysaccharide/colanic/teichoic acid biosynthesis glycosyltransferase